MERIIGINMNLSIIAISRSGHNFLKENIKAWLPNSVIYDLENLFGCPDTDAAILLKTDFNIILLRDYLNNIASMCFLNINYENCLISWKNLVFESFKKTNRIGKKIIVFYEDFKDNEDYRKNICNQICGNYNELKLNYVPNCNGNFSSFDKNKYKNNGTKMNTNSRWKQILNTKNKKLFIDIIKSNKNNINLYLKYFNVSNEKQQFINKIFG